MARASFPSRSGRSPDPRPIYRRPAPRFVRAPWIPTLVFTTDRAAYISFAEFEVPSEPRAAFVSFAEFEVPNEPRAAFVSFAEFEVPNEPRAAFVSFAEFEVPNAPAGGGDAGQLYKVRRYRGMRTRHGGGPS